MAGGPGNTTERSRVPRVEKLQYQDGKKTKKDLTKKINIKEGRESITNKIERRYWLKKGIYRVIEELKQIVTSTTAKGISFMRTTI